MNTKNMSKKYLDSKGVSYLWQKIKSELSEISLTPGPEGPRGEQGSVLYNASTYSDYITNGYESSMRINDLILDNGESVYSRRGSVYRIIDINDDTTGEFETNEIYVETQFNDIPENKKFIIVSKVENKDKSGYTYWALSNARSTSADCTAIQLSNDDIHEKENIVYLDKNLSNSVDINSLFFKVQRNPVYSGVTYTGKSRIIAVNENYDEENIKNWDCLYFSSASSTNTTRLNTISGTRNAVFEIDTNTGYPHPYLLGTKYSSSDVNAVDGLTKYLGVFDEENAPDSVSKFRCYKNINSSLDEQQLIFLVEDNVAIYNPTSPKVVIETEPVTNLLGSKGEPGKDGDVPYIGSNGNWFIAGVDTGFKSKGDPGIQGNGFYVMSEDDIARLIQCLKDNRINANKDNIVEILLSEANTGNVFSQELATALCDYFEESNYNYYLVDGYLFGNVISNAEYVTSYEMYKIKGEQGPQGPVGEYSQGNNIDITDNTISAKGYAFDDILKSFSEGDSSHATGNDSHAEGFDTYAEGICSHAEGSNSHAKGDCSHAEGDSSITEGYASHSEGVGSIASGYASHSEGFSSKTGGSATSNDLTTGAETSSGAYAHAEGNATIAKGASSHTEGRKTFASGNGSHAEGNWTRATGNNSHAEGSCSYAEGPSSHAEGDGTHAEGDASHAEGFSSHAESFSSHAEGYYTVTTNIGEHAEGIYNKSNYRTLSSIGIGSDESDRKNAFEVMENGNAYLINAGGYDGTNPDTSATIQEVLPKYDKAKRSVCFQYNEEDGSYNQADGYYSFVTGYNNKAHFQQDMLQAGNSFVGGDSNNAYHQNTLVFGKKLFTQWANTFVLGKYNAAVSNHDGWGDTVLGIVGDGYEDVNGVVTGRNVILVQGGNDPALHCRGGFKNNASWINDFGEYFEWLDGNPNNEDRIGYMVQLNGDKIELATSLKKCIGVISGTTGFIGGVCAFEWHNKFLHDKWGREIVGEDGNPIINPDYNPELEYIPREQRKEWDVVGLVGQVITRQDGTLEVGGYAGCNNGIATNATRGFKVLKIIDNETALLLVK